MLLTLYVDGKQLKPNDVLVFDHWHHIVYTAPPSCICYEAGRNPLCHWHGSTGGSK